MPQGWFCVDRVSKWSGVAVLGLAAQAFGQAGQQAAVLPEAPSSLLLSSAVGTAYSSSAGADASSAASAELTAALPVQPLFALGQVPGVVTPQQQQSATDAHGEPIKQGPIGEDGKPIKPQTGRVFGILPNFVSVSGGTKPKPAGWKTDFDIANKQNYDYSAFGFLLISSSLAYAQNSHPAFNTYNGGNAVFWAYLWRGFVDKTDAVYQGTFFFPALLHEDTRYYAVGTGSAKRRLLHAVLSPVVAHNYDQKPIFNLAGQLGRVGTQAVSTTYYPAGSEGFGVLVEKYAYSNLRSMIYAIVREYSPDAQAIVARRHDRKKAEKAAAQGE